MDKRIDDLDTRLERLDGRLKAILAAKTTTHRNLQYRPGKLFAMRRQPPKEQPFVVVMKDGLVVATTPTRDLDPDRLVRLMVGRDLHDVYG